MQNSSLIRRAAIGASTVGAAIAAPIAARAATALEAINANATAVGTKATLIGSGQTNSLPDLVGRYIAAALGLLGIVLVVIVIYAGFLWMTAQGNDEKVKQAKKMISNAVVGMVLIFAAYAITNFVIGALITASSGA